MPTKKELMLIDGHAIAFRAYYAMERQNLTNSLGLPVGAVFSFYRMLAKLLMDWSPNYFLLVFDPLGDNFRHELYSEYKANRTETPDDLKVQLQEILDIAKIIKAPTFIPENVEADDAIASLVERYKNSEIEIIIVSGDKDLFALLHKNVRIFRPKKGVSEFKEINAKFVEEDLGINFLQMTDFLAMTGDSSDNIPGVKGIGPKGASELLKKYGDLKSIYNNIDILQSEGIKKKLIVSKENAFLSQKLISLKKDVPLEHTLEELNTKNFIKNSLSYFTIFKEKELNVVYQDWLTLADKKKMKAEGVGEYSLIIRTKSEWEDIKKEIKKAEFVSVDTETTHYSPMQAKLLGVAIAWSDQLSKKEIYRSVYIPCIFEEIIKETESVGESDLFNPLNDIHPDYKKSLYNGSEVLEWLREFLESSEIKKIGQNIKYDWLVLRRHGVNLGGVIADTMLLSFLLKPTQRRHNLDDMALDHIGHTTIKYSDLVGSGKKQKTLLSVSLDQVAKYSCEDAEVTLRLYKTLLPMIEKKSLYELYHKIDLPLAYVIMIMEENGVVLDTDYLKKLSKIYEDQLKKIKEQIFVIVGEHFNIQSTQELRRILFTKLGIVSDRKTGKGQLSTDHKVLESLKNKHPVIPHLLEFRLLSKLLSTYLLPLPQAVYKPTNRIHTSFSQVITATGRLSSMEPNLQNIPIKGKEGRAMRRAFVAPTGCELLSLDYSQIELRILAHYSEDKNLLQAYLNDEDIHDQATYLLFNQYFCDSQIKWDLASSSLKDEKNQYNTLFSVGETIKIADLDTKRLALMKRTAEFNDLRSKAKILNFSIIYGVTEWGLSQNLNISRFEAGLLMDAYFTNYPGIKKYMLSAIEIAKEQGYSKNLLGRKRLINDLNHKNRFKREAAERLAINTPIQSTAADIVKIAMLNIQQELENKKLKTKMILQIHDELLFEVPISEKEEVFEIAKHKLENAFSLKVPLKINGRFGKNWDEAK